MEIWGYNELCTLEMEWSSLLNFINTSTMDMGTIDLFDEMERVDNKLVTIWINRWIMIKVILACLASLFWEASHLLNSYNKGYKMENN